MGLISVASFQRRMKDGVRSNSIQDYLNKRHPGWQPVGFSVATLSVVDSHPTISHPNARQEWGTLAR